MLKLDAIRGAQARISPYVRQTPLIYSAALSARTGGEVWLKAENLQPTGSFKVRGAVNKVGLLSAEERARGIVTGSAGNHGLGVAFAAQAWDGVQADIFCPTTAPRAKLDKLRRFDVSLHLIGATYEDAHQAAEAHARQTGAIYVQAYDDLDVMAGQGTMALEVLLELPEPDLLLVPVGGGGMIAGVAVAARARAPGCRVVGVQPEASPAALLSLREGRGIDPYEHEPTLADGLAGGFGVLAYDVAGALIDDVLLTSEAELRRAVFTLLDQEQLVAEASGAISIVPLLNGSLDVSGQTVVCVLSGGNLDTTLLRDILVEFTDDPRLEGHSVTRRSN
jgi:threonine dehydratase